MTVEPIPAPIGQFRQMARRFRRERLAMAALAYLVLVALAGFFSHWLMPYDPKQVGAGGPFESFSGTHWLGTDDLGRDVLSRIISGARISMMFSIVVVLGALLLAIPIGLVSGYIGGWVGSGLMRVMEAIQSLPFLVLAISLVAVLGPSLRNAMISVAVAMVPSFSRLVRGQVLAVREETYIEASRAIGLSTPRIVKRHVLPNVMSPIIVQASIALGSALLAEAGLSFLGLGVQPPQATWGGMVRKAFEDVLEHPWAIMPAGAAIALAVLAFNFVGDGLRKSLGAGQSYRRQGRLGLTLVGSAQTVSGQTVSGQTVLGAGATTTTTTTTMALAAAPSSSSRGSGPSDREPLLDVKGLTVTFETPRGRVTVVEDVSFTIAPGETLGLVGESGSGKTVTSLAMMRLLPSPPARIDGGQVLFHGQDLAALSFDELRKFRGSEMAMVFQDPMASLNPSMTIVNQIAQVARWHEGASRADARKRAIEVLEMVGISAGRATSYPHEFSGGMRQRAMIAMALVCRPKLLIADEPTTALDVTIQAQVLELLRELRDDLGMALLFVTHDLGVVADICDRVAVMYAGQIVETAPVRELFYDQRHPYTEGLLRAMPQQAQRKAALYSIPGQVPQPYEFGVSCRLASRCPYVQDRCRTDAIALTVVGSDHLARCVRTSELVLGSTRRSSTHGVGPQSEAASHG